VTGIHSVLTERGMSHADLLIVSLKFVPGTMVVLSQQEYPVHLRPHPDAWYEPDDMLPQWSPGHFGIILQIFYAVDDGGELFIKVAVPGGVGWTDWWNIEKC
jgi:hypothetical protein